MSRRPRLNLDGLDLGDIHPCRRHKNWSGSFFQSLRRPQQPPETLPETLPEVKPSRPLKPAGPPLVKPERLQGDPLPEEIEAAKTALRNRHPSERLKPR